MVDEVRDFLKMYNVDDDDHTESSEIDKIFDADYNNLYDRVKADCEEVYNQTEKRLDDLFRKYGRNINSYTINSGIGGYIYPYQQMSQIGVSTLPQMIDITNKKAFIVLGIFEYDSIPHDMRLLVFAESEEKVRELIDATYSTDTSFFMVKNIKEA